MRTMKTLTATLLMSLCLPLAALAASQEGGGSPGGGNSVAGKLFDFYEDQGVQDGSVLLKEEILAAKKVLQKSIGAYLPYFENILDVYKNKKIFVDSRKVGNASCTNSGSLLVVDTKVVACQNRYEIRFNKAALATMNEHNKIGLVIHEALLSLRLDDLSNNRALTEYQVRELNRRIFKNSFSSENDALIQLRELGFYNHEVQFEDSLFYTTSSLKERKEIIAKYLSQMCSSSGEPLNNKIGLGKMRNEAYQQMLNGDNSNFQVDQTWSVIFHTAYDLETGKTSCKDIKIWGLN